MSELQTFLCACPVVREETLTLYQWADVGGSRRLIGFDKEILWLRQSESRITLQHRGAVIKERGTYNDWYGFLTSVEGAIGECGRIARSCKIKPRDRLEVVVTTSVFDEPALKATDKYSIDWNKDANRKYYCHAPSGMSGWWFTSSQKIEGDELGRYPTLERLPVVEIVIYSTKSDPIDAIPDRVKAWMEATRSQLCEAAH